MTTYSANGRAELTVSDEGSGIPQRVQKRIFERFYTADSAGGSGLGPGDRHASSPSGWRDEITISSSRRFTAFTLDLPLGPRDAAATARRPRPGQGRLVKRCGAARGAAGLPGPARRLRLGRKRRQTGGRVRSRRLPSNRRWSIETSSPGFDAARVYSEASPGVVTIRSVFDSLERGRGLRLRPRRPGRDRHQRPRRHRRIRRRPRAGQGSLHRVPRPQRRAAPKIVGFDPFADVALLRGRPDGFELHPLELGDDRDAAGRPAGGGDRQPLRRAAVALGRRRLGHRPLGRIADRIPDRAARSRPTPRSTPATPAGRCSTPAPA